MTKQELRPLRALRNLTLDDTNVTDAGLVHLYGLTRLQTVSLIDTGVTSAGVQQLQAALPNCQIDIQRQD